MRSPRAETITSPAPADTLFQAALGVVQNAKGTTIVAVHNEGHKLVFRDKPKMSNARFQQVWVEDRGDVRELNVVVGTDPRTPKALLDGTFNDKALKKYLEALRGAVDGSAPAPATSVANFYLQGKTEVPWVDPAQEPDIDPGGHVRAVFGL